MISIQRERTFVATFLLLIALVLSHSVHVGWVEYEGQIHERSLTATSQDQPLFAPANHRPDGYRVAMPFLGRAVMKATHLPAASVAGLFDLLAGFVACFLLYRTMADPLPPGQRRLTAVLCFLAILQFPMAWVVPWQRPETLPSAVFVALFLFSMMRARQLRWVAVIAMATAVQGLIRTDVPLVLSVATLITGLLPSRDDVPASRRRILGIGGLMLAITVAAQAYLQFVRFTHLAPVPGLKVVMLVSNLTPHMLFNITIALLPFLLLVAYLLAKRPSLDGIDRLILLSSGLYLIPFFIFAVIHEVRIIVPFMLALSIVAAKAAAGYLAGEPDPH